MLDLCILCIHTSGHQGGVWLGLYIPGPLILEIPRLLQNSNRRPKRVVPSALFHEYSNRRCIQVGSFEVAIFHMPPIRMSRKPSGSGIGAVQELASLCHEAVSLPQSLAASSIILRIKAVQNPKYPLRRRNTNRKGPEGSKLGYLRASRIANIAVPYSCYSFSTMYVT